MSFVFTTGVSWVMSSCVFAIYALDRFPTVADPSSERHLAPIPCGLNLVLGDVLRGFGETFSECLCCLGI